MKRRLLAIVLAGVMVFSQSGAVLAAENAVAGSTSVETAAEEEPSGQQEKSEENAEKPTESVREEVSEESTAPVVEKAVAEEEEPSEEEAEDASEPVTEEKIEEVADPDLTEGESATEGSTEEAIVSEENAEILPEEETVSETANAIQEVTVHINNEEDNGILYADGKKEYSLNINSGELKYSLTPEIVTCNIDKAAVPADACFIDGENNLVFDGAKLAEAGVNFIEAGVLATVEGKSTAFSSDNTASLEVREVKIERYFNFDDRDILPGWDHWVDKRHNCYVENSDYPEGQNFELTVNDIALSDENVVQIESSDENGWNLRALKEGVCTVTVTYTDWDGTEDRKETFKLYVGSDVYYVDVRPEDNSYKVLPDQTATLIAQAHHEQYAEGEDDPYSEPDLSGIKYAWSFHVENTDSPEDITECISLKPDETDSNKATISFSDLPEDCHWADIRVTVTISEDGEDKAENGLNLYLSTEYLELWPTEIDSDLDVGETITIAPELRKYESGKENYEVLTEGVRFESEIYDDSAYELTAKEDGTYTLKRLRGYNTSFRLKAFLKDGEGNEEEVDNREYWLNEKDYDFSYNIEGNDTIFSDGSRRFGFNLDNLKGVDFELVPYVGEGEWTEEGGFMKAIEQGWSFDKEKNEITFDGEALHEAGIEWFSTRIALKVGGIEVEKDAWHGFEVREASYDYHGVLEDRVMLICDDPLHIDKTGSVYIESSAYPDGTEGEYTITEMTYKAEEDPIDSRDPIAISSDDSNWIITPVRNGEVQVHAVLSLNNGETTQEKDFTVIVGGWRYYIDLISSTGSDKLLAGGEITLSPKTGGEEYYWQTGQYYEIDTSKYPVRYEVICHQIDQKLVDEEYGGDFEKAATRGELWDYAEDEDNRAITVTAKENVTWMELEVAAYLVDPDTEEDLASNSRNIYVNSEVYEIVLLDAEKNPIEWKEELPPGGTIEFTPAVVCKKNGSDPVEITEVTFTMEWNMGRGEDDPAHLQITDKDGKSIVSGDGVSAENGPFKVKRMTHWDENLYIRANWLDAENGEQDTWIDLKFADVNYSDGLIKNTTHGHRNFAYYYVDEEAVITPDREKLDELKEQGYDVTTTVLFGIKDGEEIIPIQGFDDIFNEKDGLRVSGEKLKELKNYLEEQTGIALACMRIQSELGGVTLVDHTMEIRIVEPYYEISELSREMFPGSEQIFEGGKALFYVEDSKYDPGQIDSGGIGEYFDVTITDISLDNADDSEYLTVLDENGSWTLAALKKADHEIPITFTFTGGPEGYTTCKESITITDDMLEVKLWDSDPYDTIYEKMLMGQTLTLTPIVKHIANTESGVKETVLPNQDDPYDYEVEYVVLDEKMAAVDDSTGEVTPLMTGIAYIDVTVWAFRKDNPEERSRYYFPVDITISTFFTELKVPEDSVFYVEPGKSYKISEIGEALDSKLYIYSMKDPDGRELEIAKYIAAELTGDGESMSLSEADEDGYAVLKVAGGLADGAEMMILKGFGEEGFAAGAVVNVVVQLKPKWVKNNTGWWYDYGNGTYPAGCMETIDGKVYYFNGSGYMQTGWQKIDGKWYYFSGGGAMQTGWQKISGKWYYFDTSGVMQMGWQKISEKWYYFSGGGAMQTGWQKIGGAWYYLSGSGAMQTGWQKISGKWYYFSGGGAMVTGTQVIGGKTYKFSSSGALL